MKKIFLLFFFLFLPIVFSTQSINNLNIKSAVPLDETVTVNGLFVDSDSNLQVLCSAEIRNDSNVTIMRLTDQYTFGNHFFFEQKITEPLFLRGSDYNFLVTCKNAQSINSFSVEQRRTFIHQGIEEWKFFWEHNQFIFVMGTAILIAFGLSFLFYRTVTGK